MRESRAAQRNAPQGELPQRREASQRPQSLVGDAVAAGEVEFLQRQAGEPRQAGVRHGGFVDGQAVERGEIGPQLPGCRRRSECRRAAGL